MNCPAPAHAIRDVFIASPAADPVSGPRERVGAGQLLPAGPGLVPCLAPRQGRHTHMRSRFTDRPVQRSLKSSSPPIHTQMAVWQLQGRGDGFSQLSLTYLMRHALGPVSYPQPAVSTASPLVHSHASHTHTYVTHTYTHTVTHNAGSLCTLWYHCSFAGYPPRLWL